MAMVWISCRQTHEQAYVSARKRLCLQASTQMSTWQEASRTAMGSPPASKSLGHGTECLQQSWKWWQPLEGQALPATPSTEVLTIPPVTHQTQKL